MRHLIIAVAVLLSGCNFVLRDLLHVPVPLAEVDAKKPHANVEIVVVHPKQFSAHVDDMVRYADFHGGDSGVLPTPSAEKHKTGWDATLRAPVGDGYWLVETDFYHLVTTETCRQSCQTSTERVRDAKCGAGGDYHFEDGHTYRLEYSFEGHAKCSLTCTEQRVVDGTTITKPCDVPESSAPKVASR